MRHFLPRGAPLPPRFERSGFIWFIHATAFKHKTFSCTLHLYLVLRHSMYICSDVPDIIESYYEVNENASLPPSPMLLATSGFY